MEKYKAIKQIGKGGFGRAILVRSLATNELKVVKEIKLEGLSSKLKQSAFHEVEVLKNIEHTNIIKYQNYVKSKSKLLILMEYADGGDLTKLIQGRNGKLIPEETILDYFVQICLAIKYLHDRKILHRDLKPQNIFLSKGNIVKLGDFGISKSLEHTEDLAKTMIGTPAYYSPEICVGKKYGAKSDIWSLGCVLYELLTLKKAFSGRNIADCIRNIILKEPYQIPLVYSHEIRDLTFKLLIKKPKNRPSINDIFKMPLIRNKAIALLGKTLAGIELNHEIFHGIKPGLTPENYIENIHLVIDRCETNEGTQRKAGISEEIREMALNLQSVIINDNLVDLPEEVDDLKLGEFYFMGRKLIMQRVKNSDPLSFKIESVRVFLEEILGAEKLKEIYDSIIMNPGNEGKMQAFNLSQSDLYLFQLVMQIVAYEKLTLTMGD